jgi:hypothetical protein
MGRDRWVWLLSALFAALMLALPTPRLIPHRSTPSPRVPRVRAQAWLTLASVTSSPPVGVRNTQPLDTPYGTVSMQSKGAHRAAVLQYGAVSRLLMALPARARLHWIRATGPWLVYWLETGIGFAARVEIGAVDLAGSSRLVLADMPAHTVRTASAGSHRVALLTETSGVLVWQLPSGPGHARLDDLLPAREWAAVSASVAQGYDAEGVALPGLSLHPPRYPGLVPASLGNFRLPCEAPPGWIVVPPANRDGLTAVQVVNPQHPDQWIAVILNPHGRILSVPPLARATVPLSDVTLAFESPGPGTLVYNGVLYPDPAGGTSEVVVALPRSQHRMATHILNSVGLPY